MRMIMSSRLTGISCLDFPGDHSRMTFAATFFRFNVASGGRAATTGDWRVCFAHSFVLRSPLFCFRLHSHRIIQLHSINSFCCSPLREDEGGKVVGDEGFYDPELHSIDEDSRVLHVPVCSVGATKKVWLDVLRVGGDDWSEAKLQQFVISYMQNELGQRRASRRAFDKQTDLSAWYLDQTMLSASLHSWKHFPDDVELVARTSQSDRIDRLIWKVPSSRKELQRWECS
jgi:hypothetical protein